MSEFSSSYMDSQNQQNAYDEARASASAQMGKASGKYSKELQKYEHDREDGDETYAQLKQTLEILGAPLTEEGVKSLAKGAYEKFKNRVGKASSDLVNKYGDTARAKLEEGFGRMKARGVHITDAMKSRLTDSVDHLNNKRKQALGLAEDAQNRATTHGRDIRDAVASSDASLHTAHQQGLSVARPVEVSETSFGTDGAERIRGTVANAPDARGDVSMRETDVAPRARGRNYRGLPKMDRTDSEARKNILRDRAQRRKNYRASIGLPEQATSLERNADLARARQMTTTPKLDPVRLGGMGDADIGAQDPREFFKHASGMAESEVEKLKNPFSMKNVLGAKETDDALSNLKIYKSRREMNASRTAQAEFSRRNALATGKLPQIEELHKVAGGKNLMADSLMPMREMATKLQTSGVNSANFKGIENDARDMASKHQSFETARSSVRDRLFGSQRNPVSSLADLSRAPELPSLLNPDREQQIDDLRTQQDEEGVNRIQNMEVEPSARSEPTVAGHRQQNEAIGESAPPEQPVRGAVGDILGAREREGTHSIINDAGSILTDGKGVVKSMGLQAGLGAVLATGGAGERAKEAGIMASSDLASRVGQKAIGEVGGLGGLLPGMAETLAGSGTAREKAKSIGEQTGMGVGQETVDSVAKGVGKSALEEAGEDAGTTMAGIEAGGLGPEDPFADVAAGIAGLGMLLGGIFGKKHHDAPPPPPPPRPSLNPGVALGI